VRRETAERGGEVVIGGGSGGSKGETREEVKRVGDRKGERGEL